MVKTQEEIQFVADLKKHGTVFANRQRAARKLEAQKKATALLICNKCTTKTLCKGCTYNKYGQQPNKGYRS